MLPTVRRGEFLPVLAAPSVSPAFMVSGRLAALLLRRGAVFTVPRPVATAGTGPVPPTVTRQSRRPQLPVRRGEFLATPFPLPAGPGPVAPQMLRQTRRAALPSRRGEFATPVPAAQVPTVPGFVPRPGRRTAARSLLIRRGEFLLVPNAAPTAPRGIAASRWRLVVTRRGEFFGPVPPPAVAGVSWVPTRSRPRRASASLARPGAFLPVPLVGAPPPVLVRGDMRPVDRAGTTMLPADRPSTTMTPVARGVATMSGG
ncbi:hypothetical protein ACWEF6_02605 [Amycolatopsis sp. NPDC004772]